MEASVMCSNWVKLFVFQIQSIITLAGKHGTKINLLNSGTEKRYWTLSSNYHPLIS